MDRTGPRTVMELGVVMMAAGLLLAPLTSEPWHLYLTIGVLVGAGSVCLGYSGQSLFLPNWFVRKRGLAVGIAFAGVGIGSITLLPWMQMLIEQAGWRTACWTLGLLILVRARADQPAAAQAAAGSGAAARRRRRARGKRRARLQCRRSRLGIGRLDAGARAAHAAILVAGAGLLHAACTAGTPCRSIRRNI